MRTLTPDEARRWRWSSQLLGGSDLSPTQVVDRAIALQGQDLPAVLRAIAIRSRPGTTIADVRAAFDRGELVRSWPVRGTLFATTPAHLTALLSLTADRIHRSTIRRREQLGLDDDTLSRAHEVAQETLAGGLTRSELLALWADAGIEAAGGRGYHLIFHHAVAGRWHWGAFRGDEQVLTPSPGESRGEDPLPRIIRGLVAARGPVTDDDLAWWLKLPKTQVRKAAASADLDAVSIDGAAAWVADLGADPGDTGVTLVPGFDEWILGYGDRSLTASAAMQAALVPGNNGVFRPAVIVDGVTVGTWRARAKSRRDPSFELVEKVPAATRRRIERAVEAWPHD
ncbi:DNA glycosylase AlkZ-like family protein [Microbacterium karelineae]|uniref:DNA glycosylase AlkZ-like family protein n=1 Tax=Microbacterium karelineae TaxID=2654283 RepID=UPI0012E9F040|nr:crosslink repair DNA glycosylase YcaQ family protein [Microbacterium karelineae]